MGPGPVARNPRLLLGHLSGAKGQRSFRGFRSIEPGTPGRETALVRSLARAIANHGRMPLRGPFVSREEVDEIVTWIDTGMPEGPEAD